MQSHPEKYETEIEELRRLSTRKGELEKALEHANAPAISDVMKFTQREKANINRARIVNKSKSYILDIIQLDFQVLLSYLLLSPYKAI